jgi:malonyl CoA-acyl carrier protein transacylase
MIAFIFPGQGSQKKGMGADLFDSVAEFAELEPQIDEILGYSLRRVCLVDPGGILRQTEFTQPCLYTVNALHFFARRAAGERCDIVAGHSLGEYNALHAANAFDFLTGLQLVQKRGALMANARAGGMAAVIGLEAGKIAETIAAEGFGDLDLANFNTPEQTVVSGDVDELNRALPAFEAAGARACIKLPVSAAFHSRMMADAAEVFGDYLAGFTFSDPETPVISNVTAEAYPTGDPQKAVRRGLVDQICSAVRWRQSVRHMRAVGVSDFVEIGPGSVLTRMTAEIDQ